MTVQPSDFDPYRTPALPEGSAFAPTAGNKRPGWLTALCVIAIVIGILGAINGVVGIFGVIFGQQLQSAFTPAAPPGMSQGLQKVQQDFQDEMQAVQGKFFVQLLTSAVFRVIVAILLLVGGVMCLSLKPQGRQLLLLACALALLFEIGSGLILHSLINMEVMSALNAFLDGMSQEIAQRGNSAGGEIAIKIMRFSIVGGFVVQYMIVVLKLALYGFGLIYLQRASIKALFAEAASPRVALK